MEFDEAQQQRLNELKKHRKLEENKVNIDNNNWLISLFTKVLLLSTPFLVAFIFAVPIPHERDRFILYVSAGLSISVTYLGLTVNVFHLKIKSKALSKRLKIYRN